MTDQFTLYGTPFSLYTAKLRAYLRYKRIPHKEELATIGVFKRVLVPKTGLRVVPVLQTPSGEYLQDTADIIDQIEGEYTERPVIPKQGLARFVSHLLELYGDEWLVIPAMHYRWNFSGNSSYIDEAFGSLVSPRLPGFAKRFVGKKIGARFRGMLPTLGITGLMIPAIESWYEEDLLPTLNAHFEQHDYLLGATPTLGDFAFFGPMFGHLYQDPVPGKRMRMDAPYVVRWIERLQHHAEDLESDARLVLSRSLSPIFARMMKEQLPVLKATVAAVENLHGHQLEKIPRVLEACDFSIGESLGNRRVLPFQQWKLQRVLDCYHRSSSADRAHIDKFLEKVGGQELTHIKIQHRVTRRDNRLVFENV